ncbi:MAG: hypothetical protein JWQ35_674 [Bacteriovoracaceae bacterium]|nr:hypothetical protein [Bacteriovoracaceae bacterium]
MKIKWVIAVVVLLAAGVMTFKMFSLAQIECSLCITFKEQHQCSKALGPDEAAATEEAHRNACAQVTQGVTEAFNCGRVESENLKCGRR